jgi:tyrosine-protein phosphatase SIW14
MMFTQVDEHVWRGPRPTPGWSGLKLAEIISLEGKGEDDKEVVEFSPTPVVSMPIGFSQIYFEGISLNYLESIVTEVVSARDRGAGAVLVHCQHGEDRTGLVIAAYRVRFWGWTKEKAMAEALQFGYRNWLNFGLNKTWKAFEESK